MPDQPLANTFGQIDREALRARINAVLKSAEPTRPVLRPLTVERDGTDIRVRCWCGKAKRLETRNINVFVRAFNDFLYEHSWCEPGDAA